MNRWMALGLMALVGACGGMEPQEPTDTSETAIIEDDCWDCECPEPEPEYRCETAFAWGGECYENNGPAINTYVPPPDECEAPVSKCFDEWDISRWGWTNEITWSVLNSAPGGVVKMPLLVGAAHCNTYAPQVGWVKVWKEYGKLVVRYVVWPGYKLDETHLYVGGSWLPTKPNGKGYTVAPGQYGLHHDLNYASWDQYKVYKQLPAHVIAHAVVCWRDGEVNGAATCD